MQIIATVRFCFMPTRMTIIIIKKKEREKVTSDGVEEGNWNFLCIAKRDKK